MRETETGSIQDAINVMKVRFAVYDLFRRFFSSEPSQDYLQSCINLRVFEAFPFQEDSLEIAAGIEKIAAELPQYANNKRGFERLHWDYTRMFIGPMHPTAPPWASYYLEEDHMLFQATTFTVRTLYLKHGFIAGDHMNSEADDHIGLEMDFMYQLNHRCIRLLESELEDKASLNWKAIADNVMEQQDFVKSHLLRYMPQFKEAVEAASETDFYKGLVKALLGYLEIDQKISSDLLLWISECRSETGKVRERAT